jgi:hypothetical protein
MDLRAVAAGYSPREALRLEHDALPRYAVLCPKLLALLWLVTGQVVHFSAVLVPFYGAHAISTQPFVAQALVLAQLVAILTIVCSRFVRTGCALLAAIIGLLLALDQPLFSNNRAFCALVLVMLALGQRGALARYQVALVYAAAAVDKLLSADWRSGWFLRTFTEGLCETGALGNFGAGTVPLPATCWLSQQLGASPALAAGCSALVIGTELAIALGYLLSLRATVPLAVAFHGLLLAATGSTFGIFFYACLATSVLVLDQRADHSARA